MVAENPCGSDRAADALGIECSCVMAAQIDQHAKFIPYWEY